MVTLQAAAGGVSTARFLDALIGSAVALIANAVVDRSTRCGSSAREGPSRCLRELAAALEEVRAGATRPTTSSEIDAAALRRARALDAARRAAPRRAGRRPGDHGTGRRPGVAPGSRSQPYAVALTSIDHARPQHPRPRAAGACRRSSRTTGCPQASVRGRPRARPARSGSSPSTSPTSRAPRSSRPSAPRLSPRHRRPRRNREPLGEHDHRSGARHRRRPAGRDRRRAARGPRRRPPPREHGISPPGQRRGLPGGVKSHP